MISRKQVDPATLSWLILTLLSFMWGSSFILIKKGLIAFDAGTVGALRISSASVFLLVLAIRRSKKVKTRHWITLLIVGFLGSFIPAFLYAKGQTQIESSVAGVLNAITPLWVIIIGILVFSQRITFRILIGMTLGFIGTAWLVIAGTDGKFNFNYHALYIITATLCYGINLNLIKFKLPELDSLTITSVSMAMVGPVAVGFLFLQTDFLMVMRTDPYAWWSFGAISLLGVMGTALALILFFKLVQVTTPVFASSVTYLIPIVAVLWGVIDGENLSLGQITGMILILIGVFIANRRRQTVNRI